MAYKISNPKKEKQIESDLFKVPKTELDEDTSFEVEEDSEEKKQADETFKQERADAIVEINEDLYSEEIPIEIKDAETLNVKAGGTDHKITRKDLAQYQKTQMGNEYGYRQLGDIGGDAGMVDKIAQDIEWTFNRLDEKLNTYRTSQGGDD